MTAEERAEFIVEAIFARLMLSHTTIDEAGQATGKLQQMVIDTIRAAALEENEACAKLASPDWAHPESWNQCRQIAAAIRSRGEEG